MKFYAFLFAALTLASPQGAPLDKRQSTQNDLSRGACKKVIFIFARASTEPGNMVSKGHPLGIEAQD